MDLETAKLKNGRLYRYAMLAALACLLLTAAILITVSFDQVSASKATTEQHRASHDFPDV